MADVGAGAGAAVAGAAAPGIAAGDGGAEVSVSFVFRRFFRPPRFRFRFFFPALPPDAETLPGDGGAARFRVSRSRFVPSRHSRRTRAESSSSGSGPGKRGSKSSGVGAGGPRGAEGRCARCRGLPSPMEPSGWKNTQTDDRHFVPWRHSCDREFGSSPSGDGRGGGGPG